MLNSLKLYARYFSLALINNQKRNFLLNDFRRSRRKRIVEVPVNSPEQKKEALQAAVYWLLRAQQMMQDDGMGSFHLINGWSASYPETTGYIIPTLFNSLDVLPEEIVEERTIDAAEWLLGIQNENGGWQGGKVNENKPPVVFNTGQVIRGMLAVYKKTGKEQYLNAAKRAGDWLCEIQHENGYWKKNALMRQARVYDSYVDAPLIYLSEVSGDVKYKKYAIRNLNWIVDLKQLENGWFEDCDNTIKRNDQPILHTIAYTIDGLLDSGMALHDDKYIKSACIPTDVLLHKFIENNYLNNRFDKDWKGREYMMNTGCAQIAIVWLKLAALKNNREYFDAAAKMIDLLIYIQNRGKYDKTDTRGALPGSFPIWGKYEPFAFPNWATKYFCDSLILENKTRKIFHAE